MYRALLFLLVSGLFILSPHPLVRADPAREQRAAARAAERYQAEIERAREEKPPGAARPSPQAAQPPAPTATAPPSLVEGGAGVRDGIWAAVVAVLLSALVFLWLWFRYQKCRFLQGRPWVIDGDTIRVAGKQVRLAGLDAAELGQMCTDASGRRRDEGEAVKDELIQKIGGRVVTVEGEDVYDVELIDYH